MGSLPRVIEAKIGLEGVQSGHQRRDDPIGLFPPQAGTRCGGGSRRRLVVDFAALLLRDDAPLGACKNYPELATIADCFELAAT